jgi:diguanylate cyclase (GGDEF)-like protein
LRGLPLAGIETTWERSVVAAVAAREVALTLRFPAPDEAFLGALLQDIGMVAFARLAGVEYEVAVTSAGGDRARLRALEVEMFGADHGEVGGWLLGTWGMPGPLCLVVAASDGGGPDQATLDIHDDVRRLTTIVRFSGALADVWVDADVGRAVAHARREARSTLDLGAGTVEPILARTAAAIPGVASLFDLSFGAAEEIAATLEEGAAALVTPTSQVARHIDWAHAAVGSLLTKGGPVAPSSERDAVTGLANRARLESYLAGEFTGALASGKPLTVIAANVDRFGSILQGLGRVAGDEVLVGMARALDGNLRSRDLVARSGGEAFVLVLPETDAAGARVVAERIRQKIEIARSGAAQLSLRSLSGGSEPTMAFTASFGCATLGLTRFTSAAELLAAAERALAEATRAGCNRVESDGWNASVTIPVSAVRNAG